MRKMPAMNLRHAHSTCAGPATASLPHRASPWQQSARIVPQPVQHSSAASAAGLAPNNERWPPCHVLRDILKQ